MTTNEACLHNPGPEPRTVLVERPQRPPDTVFEVDGKRDHDLTRVVVPPGGVTVVRLVAAADEPALAGRRSCSLFPSTQEELR
jgi:hypothetical protein